MKAYKVGLINVGNEFEGLYVADKTGELLTEDIYMGAIYLSPLQIEEPTGFVDDKAAMAVIEHFGVKGAALTNKYLVTFNDGVAEFRDTTDIDKVLHTANYDTDCVVDEQVTYMELGEDEAE